MEDLSSHPYVGAFQRDAGKEVGGRPSIEPSFQEGQLPKHQEPHVDCNYGNRHKVVPELRYPQPYLGCLEVSLQ